MAYTMHRSTRVVRVMEKLREASVMFAGAHEGAFRREGSRERDDQG
jgi:hypothetical protein